MYACMHVCMCVLGLVAGFYHSLIDGLTVDLCYRLLFKVGDEGLVCIMHACRPLHGPSLTPDLIRHVT